MLPVSAPALPPSPAAPGPLDPTDICRLTSRDGTVLYGEWFEAAEARALALVMHGYAEHCGRYRELAHVLVGAGLATLTFDMRGHGRSQGQRGHAESYDEYLDDMDAALAELRRRHPTSARLPLFLIGHSNGALVALRALADPVRRPRGLTAAVLSSPFLGLRAQVHPAKKVAGRVASRVMPRLSMPNELRIEDLTHDPDKLAARRVDTLCHDVASAGWYSAAVATQGYVARNAHRVDVPTLWLVAGGDRIADPTVSRAVRRRLRRPSEYHELPTMHHEVFNEVERGRVFDLLRTFLDKRISLK
jgi:alpha-beta hydrolase superfamily lysophospholipase